MAYINGNDILFSPKVTITEKIENIVVEDNTRYIPDINTALKLKGGTAEVATYKDVPAAIYDLPVGDTSYLSVKDTNEAYGKSILKGALGYAVIDEIGGALTQVRNTDSANILNPSVFLGGCIQGLTSDGGLSVVCNDVQRHEIQKEITLYNDANDGSYANFYLGFSCEHSDYITVDYEEQYSDPDYTYWLVTLIIDGELYFNDHYDGTNDVTLEDTIYMGQ